jgi:hypothetical protein
MNNYPFRDITEERTSDNTMIKLKNQIIASEKPFPGPVYDQKLELESVLFELNSMLGEVRWMEPEEL